MVYVRVYHECICRTVVTDLFLHIYLSSLKRPSVKALCFQPCLVSDKLEVFILDRFPTTEPRRTRFFLVRCSRSTSNISILGKRPE